MERTSPTPCDMEWWWAVSNFWGCFSLNNMTLSSWKPDKLEAKSQMFHLLQNLFCWLVLHGIQVFFFFFLIFPKAWSIPAGLQSCVSRSYQQNTDSCWFAKNEIEDVSHCKREVTARGKSWSRPEMHCRAFLSWSSSSSHPTHVGNEWKLWWVNAALLPVKLFV